MIAEQKIASMGIELPAMSEPSLCFLWCVDGKV